MQDLQPVGEEGAPGRGQALAPAGLGNGRDEILQVTDQARATPLVPGETALGQAQQGGQASEELQLPAQGDIHPGPLVGLGGAGGPQAIAQQGGELALLQAVGGAQGDQVEGGAHHRLGGQGAAQ